MRGGGGGKKDGSRKKGLQKTKWENDECRKGKKKKGWREGKN